MNTGGIPEMIGEIAHHGPQNFGIRWGRRTVIKVDGTPLSPRRFRRDISPFYDDHGKNGDLVVDSQMHITHTRCFPLQ